MNNKLIKKYYDNRASCQVLGILMKNPQKLKSKECALDQEDFIGGLHQTIFICIYNLSNQGLKEINLNDIETYLANADPVGYKKVFEKYDGADWILKIIEDANELNFNYYFLIVKKMSLLRSYLKEGINVSHILDLDEIDPNIIKQQRENFDRKSIEEIIKDMDKKNLSAKKRFILTTSSDRKKAGEGAKEYYQKLKDTPLYGLSFESQYLNTIFRGANRKKFFIESRTTGGGKTRIGLSRMLNFCSRELWDFNKNDFIPNPNGQENSGLYIGTEMELMEEIEPILWAYVSGVDQEKIMTNTLTTEEDKRVLKAIEILQKSPLELIYEPEFNIEILEQYAEEYKIEKNIGYLYFDYMEITDELVQESVRKRGGNIRDDIALLQLSKNLKRISKDYDLFLQTNTQIAGQEKHSENRDETILRGSKAIPDKADGGIISMPPTQKELEKVAPILAQINGLVPHRYPNMVHTIYKNRGGSVKNIKVWGYQDLGNMRWTDMFCTNEDYEQININPTKIEVIDDKVITF